MRGAGGAESKLKVQGGGKDADMAAIRNLRGESGGGTGLQFTGKGSELTDWASSSFMVPATCLVPFNWAAEPTRDTERPTELAGRWPW